MVTVRVSPFASEYIRRHALDLMSDRCRIYTPGEPVYDKETGRTVRGEGTIKYEGPCRLWEVSAGSQIVVGDDQIVTSQTYLSIPHWVMPLPETDDVVLMIESGDPDLPGRVVKIISAVRGGGLRASRKFSVKVQDSKKPTW